MERMELSLNVKFFGIIILMLVYQLILLGRIKDVEEKLKLEINKLKSQPTEIVNARQ